MWLWLMVTNQVGMVDGLFRFCSSLVIAFAFGLYLLWTVRSAMHNEHHMSERELRERPIRGGLPLGFSEQFRALMVAVQDQLAR